MADEDGALLFESTKIKNKEYDEVDTRAKNVVLEKKLIQNRKDWTEKIKLLAVRLKEVRNLTDVQIDMLSYRQVVVDLMVELKATIYKRSAFWDSYHKTKYRTYSLDYDMKLTKEEKISFIRADMASLKFQIKLLGAHLEFYQDCVKILDNMAFAIRNRITLSESDY